MLMVQGYSQREIAEKQNVSAAMVSKALHRVYAKLGASNGVEAIREALSHGLLREEDMKRRRQSMSEGLMPSEPFVDSKEKVYKAMLESLESFVHWFNYPQSCDEDELLGEIKQMEWVIERAHKLKEAEHE